MSRYVGEFLGAQSALTTAGDTRKNAKQIAAEAKTMQLKSFQS
jgi:hypothetical protein